jgi:hypothetical protein
MDSMIVEMDLTNITARVLGFNSLVAMDAAWMTTINAMATMTAATTVMNPTAIVRRLNASVTWECVSLIGHGVTVIEIVLTVATKNLDVLKAHWSATRLQNSNVQMVCNVSPVTFVAMVNSTARTSRMKYCVHVTLLQTFNAVTDRYVCHCPTHVTGLLTVLTEVMRTTALLHASQIKHVTTDGV